MYNAHLNRNKGMSLIEVMVGMVIGLIGIVVIMQVYLVNENFKRATTSAGSAQINGSISLYSIQRDVLTAGYGISDSRALACGWLRYYYNGTYSSPTGVVAGFLQPVRVAPVVITDGGANPDTIQVMYGGNSARVVPATVAAAMPSAGGNVTVDNLSGFSDAPGEPGDLILVASTGDCTMMQITCRFTATLQLAHASAATTCGALTSPATLWNPAAGGSFTAYSAGAMVFNLGKPTVNIYSISANKLQQLRVFAPNASNVVPSYTGNVAALALADDIVDMQAQYGKDTNGDGIVDTYNKTLPATAAEWQAVLSVRVAVLARSQNYEKPATGTTCTETTTQPTWSGSAVVTVINPVASPFNIALPSCYKFKVLETVIPLRNMIWSRT